MVRRCVLCKMQFSIHNISLSLLFAGDLELDCHPFPHCIIRNFLSSNTFVENLQSELMGLNFHEKSNDLYKFKQVPNRFYSLHTAVLQLEVLTYFSFLFLPCFCSYTVRWLAEEDRATHCWTEVKEEKYCWWQIEITTTRFLNHMVTEYSFEKKIDSQINQSIV